MANGMQTQQCGTKYAVFFFLGYFLMVPLIFLNLFIAIILEGFEQTSTKVNNLIQEDELEKFRECWAAFDKDVSLSTFNEQLCRVLDSSRLTIFLN